MRSLREGLVTGGARLIELLRNWDDETADRFAAAPASLPLSSEVTQTEFRKVVKAMGLSSSLTEIDSQFDAWDAAGRGRLSLQQLQQCLKDGGAAVSEDASSPNGRGVARLAIAADCTRSVRFCTRSSLHPVCYTRYSRAHVEHSLHSRSLHCTPFVTPVTVVHTWSIHCTPCAAPSPTDPTPSLHASPRISTQEDAVVRHPPVAATWYRCSPASQWCRSSSPCCTSS